MSQADTPDNGKADPRSFEGFIARVLETDGLKGAVREADKLLAGYDSREIRKAAEDMNPKVRTAVLKMLNLRSPEAS